MTIDKLINKLPSASTSMKAAKDVTTYGCDGRCERREGSLKVITLEMTWALPSASMWHFLKA
jgi:hypothetical protein